MGSATSIGADGTDGVAERGGALALEQEVDEPVREVGAPPALVQDQIIDCKHRALFRRGVANAEV
jgi:hypothetical protein